MANTMLLRKLAGSVGGISADQFRAQDLGEAYRDGLVEFSKHAGVRFARLTDLGRKALGLPPRDLGFLARLQDRFTWR